jgi:hypothetical protein
MMQHHVVVHHAFSMVLPYRPCDPCSPASHIRP